MSTARCSTRLINAYEWLLAHALARRPLVLVVIAVLAVLTFFIYKGLGSEFLPEFDEHGFILDYVAPPGASLDETDRMLRHVERMLKETPGGGQLLAAHGRCSSAWPA